VLDYQLIPPLQTQVSLIPLGALRTSRSSYYGKLGESYTGIDRTAVLHIARLVTPPRQHLIACPTPWRPDCDSRSGPSNLLLR
jgi:hypothetical protein